MNESHRKKFASLFLVFSLMMLSMNLYAKEKRGAELIITKKNGAKKEGELIAVKWNSLLILTKWSGRDESIDIADIKVITIVKESTFWKGAGLGLLIGAGIGGTGGGILGASIEEGNGVLKWVILGGAAFGIIGYLLGSITGEITGQDKTIQIEGMTNSEIREALYKLRMKARVRDYK